MIEPAGDEPPPWRAVRNPGRQCRQQRRVRLLRDCQRRHAVVHLVTLDAAVAHSERHVKFKRVFDRHLRAPACCVVADAATRNSWAYAGKFFDFWSSSVASTSLAIGASLFVIHCDSSMAHVVARRRPEASTFSTSSLAHSSGGMERSCCWSCAGRLSNCTAR